MHVARGIGVKADVVRPRVGKRSGQSVHRLNHQVHVNRHGRTRRRFGVRLQGLADHGAKRQVGHVMVVHHVEMDPVGASGNDIAHFFAQAGKVGREDGGGDSECAAHPPIVAKRRTPGVFGARQ